MALCKLRWWVVLSLLVCSSLLHAFGQADRAANLPAARQIIVPGEDRFAPFAITVRVGQPVVWINNDADDHTIVSNDAFNTAGHRGTNVILKANGGKIVLVFKHPGVFPFYCRFHSMLDADHQPKAPGPEGGIQDPNGNYGTPMNGVITVLGDD
jgi:plastocyanin